MDEKKLKRLEVILTALNEEQVTPEQFAQAFEFVLDYIRSNEENTAETVTGIVSRLTELQTKLEADSGEDRILVKKIVGESIALLRIAIDEKVNLLEERVDKKLSEVTNGKDADEIKIIGEILAQLPAPIPGKDGNTDTPDQVVEKINTSNYLIKKERVEGLVDLMKNVAASVMGSVGITTTNFFQNGTLVGRAKNINITGGTVTVFQDLATIATGSGGSGSINIETPSGTVDGTNVTFVVLNTPKYIVVDGVSKFVTLHYTLAGLIITIVDGAPPALYIRSFY